MNRDEIIRMAREAGEAEGMAEFVFHPVIERFAALVAAAERERIKLDGIHSCHSQCDKPACVNLRKAVEAEREACAVIAFNAKTYIEAANAIRARG